MTAPRGCEEHVCDDDSQGEHHRGLPQRVHAAAHDRCGEELDEQAQTRAAGLGELVREQLPAGIAAELQYIRETLRTFCAQNANVNDQLLRVEASLYTLACMIGAALHQARKDGSQLRVGTRHLRSVEESPVTIGTTAWLATLGGTVERGQGAVGEEISPNVAKGLARAGAALPPRACRARERGRDGWARHQASREISDRMRRCASQGWRPAQRRR